MPKPIATKSNLLACSGAALAAILVTAAILLFAFSALTGCNRESGSKRVETLPETRSMDTAVTTAVQDTMYGVTRRQEAAASLHRQLDSLGARIEELQAKADRASVKTRKAMRKDLAAMEKTRKELVVKMDELGNASAEKWDELKTATQRGADSLGEAVSRTWKRVTGEDKSVSAPDTL